MFHRKQPAPIQGGRHSASPTPFRIVESPPGPARQAPLAPRPPRRGRLPGDPIWDRASGLKIAFYQHGDFREALARFASGGPETYRDQRLSVTHVQNLGQRHEVTVIAMCGETYDERYGNLRLIGLKERADFEGDAAAAMLARLKPDRLIARSPHAALLRAAARAQVPTLPCLADIFPGGGPRQFIRNRRLRPLLKGRHIPCVANHSLNASQSLVRQIGLRATQVVPWDWSRLQVAAEPKTRPGTPLRLVYAGRLEARKGLDDVLAAQVLAAKQGIETRLSVAGPGDLAPWQARAAELGVAAEFLGLVPHDQVGQLMASHDAVLVPSHHSYPEGLPNTIYEGLAARSPVILSDHPSFRGRLRPREEALFFQAGNPPALAAQMVALATEPGLFARLSQNAAAALEGLYVGMDWPDLITRFVDDPTGETGWVRAHSLRALGQP